VAQLYAIESGPTPFQQFTLTAVKLEFDDQPNGDEFRVTGDFTLGTNSSGFNPAGDSFSVQVGPFSLVIPAGSLTKDDKLGFSFHGQIAGASVAIKLIQHSPTQFGFKIEADGVDLSGTANPVSVQILAGNNSGSQESRLKGELT